MVYRDKRDSHYATCSFRKLKCEFCKMEIKEVERQVCCVLLKQLLLIGICLCVHCTKVIMLTTLNWCTSLVWCSQVNGVLKYVCIFWNGEVGMWLCVWFQNSEHTYVYSCNLWSTDPSCHWLYWTVASLPFLPRERCHQVWGGKCPMVVNCMLNVGNNYLVMLRHMSEQSQFCSNAWIIYISIVCVVITL